MLASTVAPGCPVLHHTVQVSQNQITAIKVVIIRGSKTSQHRRENCSNLHIIPRTCSACKFHAGFEMQQWLLTLHRSTPINMQPGHSTIAGTSTGVGARTAEHSASISTSAS